MKKIRAVMPAVLLLIFNYLHFYNCNLSPIAVFSSQYNVQLFVLNVSIGALNFSTNLRSFYTPGLIYHEWHFTEIDKHAWKMSAAFVFVTLTLRHLQYGYLT